MTVVWYVLNDNSQFYDGIFFDSNWQQKYPPLYLLVPHILRSAFSYTSSITHFHDKLKNKTIPKRHVLHKTMVLHAVQLNSGNTSIETNARI